LTAAPPQQWPGLGGAGTQASAGLDAWLERGWLSVSLLMLGVLLVHGVQLYRRKRAWRRTHIEGRAVMVTDDIGPAVVGFLRPAIVIPAWLAQADRSRQTQVIAHEQSHLAAGDPQLFTIALCLLVFMPWNLPLWWQLKRLRNAIEVDCDARVLDAGHDAASYGETLISVGERQSAYIGAVAAMTESRSFLEERIAIMMKKPARWWQIPATALSCLSITLVAVAAQVIPPNAPESDAPTQVQVAENVLELHTGTYKLSEQQVFTVRRKGDQLSGQLTGQSALEMYPSSPTQFFNTTVKAELDFESDGATPSSAVVLRQNGATIRMPRIDAGAAAMIENALAARVSAGVPSPGTEAALRKLLARDPANGPHGENLMTPELAKAVQGQAKGVEDWLGSLGPMQRLDFQGVGTQGYDSYLVKFEKGSVLMRISMRDDKISALMLSPL